MKDKAMVYENIGVPIALLVLKESITLLNTYSHSEKTGIIKKQTVTRFPSLPGQSKFPHLQKIIKFISQSRESFSNPLKQYSIPKKAII